MKKLEKYEEYTAVILGAIGSMFDEDSEHYIDEDDLAENLTEFFHALSNVAPSLMYSELTGEPTNTLDFNHISNKLIHQYTRKKL